MSIAILGYGTVGSGVAELLLKNHDILADRCVCDNLDVKYILDLRDFPDDINQNKIIKDFNIILNDPEVDIVVETMGGINPAFDFSIACLRAKKSVVTSNKELVANKATELLKAAEENNVNYLFEASVGGGIPLITPVAQCLAADRINEIYGILNGTTNFILTKMISEDMNFDTALKLAQKNGYAEKDPTADIEGYDAQRKLCILASLCFGKHVYPESVFTQGISSISLVDVDYAQTCGYVIKLIAEAKRLDDGNISAVVAPMLVSNESMLSGVDDVFNAVLIKGDATGNVMFYGKGAGKLPTASAVVGDIADCIDHKERRKVIGWEEAQPDYVIDYTKRMISIYVRATTDNLAQAKKDIEEAVGPITLLNRTGPVFNEFAFITNTRIRESELVNALNSVESIKISACLRVAGC